ncbi:MAG: ester cyclase [bacterium]|nr:ester cyclase [bacterium]
MKQTIFIIVFILVFTLGFQSFSLADSQEEKNSALIKRFITDGWNQGKLEMCDEVIAPHCLFYGNGEKMEKTGPAMMRMAISRNMQDFPGFSITIEDLFAKDDKVVLRYVFQGTHKKVNKPVILYTALIGQFASGKVVKLWLYDDRWSALKQLGFTLQPPSAGKQGAKPEEKK